MGDHEGHVGLLPGAPYCKASVLWGAVEHYRERRASCRIAQDAFCEANGERVNNQLSKPLTFGNSLC